MGRPCTPLGGLAVAAVTNGLGLFNISTAGTEITTALGPLARGDRRLGREAPTRR